MERKSFKRRKIYRKRKPIKGLIRSIAKRTVFSAEETKQLTAVRAPSGGLATTDTGTIALLHHIPVGTTNGTRVGTRVTIMSIVMRICVVNGVATSPAYARMVVFRDINNNAALPVNTEIMGNATAGSAYLAGYNINNRKRFKILSDKMVSLNNGGGSTNQVKLLNYKLVKKFRGGIVQQYNDSTFGDQRDLLKNGLFVWVATDTGSGFPFYAYSVTVRYKDA